MTAPAAHNRPGGRPACADSLPNSASADLRWPKAPSWIRQLPLARGRRLGRWLRDRLGDGALWRWRLWARLALAAARLWPAAAAVGGFLRAGHRLGQRNALLALLERHHLVHVGQRRLGRRQALRGGAADIGIGRDRVGGDAVAIEQRGADDQQRARLAGFGRRS